MGAERKRPLCQDAHWRPAAASLPRGNERHQRLAERKEKTNMPGCTRRLCSLASPNITAQTQATAQWRPEGRGAAAGWMEGAKGEKMGICVIVSTIKIMLKCKMEMSNFKIKKTKIWPPSSRLWNNGHGLLKHSSPCPHRRKKYPEWGVSQVRSGKRS